LLHTLEILWHKKCAKASRGRAGSPLGEQVRSSLDKFVKAATLLKGSPSPQNSARFILAARNLSTNLADAGIDVSPEDIARRRLGR
jgi:hypothetical protein